LDRVKGAEVEQRYALTISTVDGEGIDELISLIGARAAAVIGQRGDVLPSRLRHVELLDSARGYLEAALSAPDALLELKAENLRLASDRIGKLSGAVDVEDLLDVIFSQFCIGK
jgi:tRNA modification GTPase